MNATQTRIAEAHQAGTCTTEAACTCSTDMVAAEQTPAAPARPAYCPAVRPGNRGTRLCVLPAGHDGDHDGGGPRCTWKGGA